MGKLLGVDIARRTARAFRGKLARAVLIKVTPATPVPGSLTTLGAPTRTEHRCFGFLDDWPGEFPSQESTRAGTKVKRVDVMATILGRSIAGGAVPTPDDELRINGTTYLIMKVGTDPTVSVGPSATYKLTMRGV